MQICSSCCHDRHKVKRDNTTGLDDRSGSAPKGELVTTTFYCCGRVPPEGLYRRRHGMSEEDRTDSSFEIATEALEDFGFLKVTNPSVPFMDNLPEDLYHGRSITVYGKLYENAHRFSINLSTGNDIDSDLALHFNPRFDRHIIVRNHRIKNKWGAEEITSLQDFPFKRGRNFSVLMLIADEQFLISVNKVHYCAFAFRIPVDRIKSVIILGDLMLNVVEYGDLTNYPPIIFKKTPFLIVPQPAKTDKGKCYFRRKVKEIKAGSKIKILGRVKILPQAFYINIQKGISVWPHPIIPFHMNYRLHLPGTHKNEREIIFNSWLNGIWGKEEIITSVPFLPGSDFHIQILCNDDDYTVLVNEKFLYNYAKRSKTAVNAVIIHGDVVINKIQVY